MSDECAETYYRVSIFYPDSLYMLMQHWLQQILDLMPMTDPQCIFCDQNGIRTDEHPLLDIAIADIRRRVSVM